jgi:hypothetical protein
MRPTRIRNSFGEEKQETKKQNDKGEFGSGQFSASGRLDAFPWGERDGYAGFGFGVGVFGNGVVCRG